ncbi:DUF1488 family protein [Escherichia coli]
MNQAIQFPDREEWDENKKCVCFPALVNGMQLTCAILLWHGVLPDVEPVIKQLQEELSA